MMNKYFFITLGLMIFVLNACLFQEKVQAKTVINGSDYEANFDGVQDDTAAIQNAINMAPEGFIIQLPVPKLRLR
ncbi:MULTISPECIES: hypothetical protein [Aneurinibacillus]|uniref:Glycoside hydrolase family 55 protein n=1 Tax=Aneurinibacillus thermoaerophilus TaxID=143495 RepID=A0ABX8Y6M9_ANETH|nr:MULTISPECIES: hypothetical protein [Aneurinibacillus]AMA72974.1 hypothetical protein ACH33_08950 [Aneurinibacillus sp. XH2]MED0675918.1 hypothetical protein [Aneurinibacillus thermoaerophilus]MED0677807.1 hypothetical protein [Aneurinibacillus thermoaerophilus]MED0737556.1 hypothetical protein [Aneurinibacillus thermoaerophilus]MED0758127.1 hypothetical protein [Aneurinibacillus thermoaerophilus]